MMKADSEPGGIAANFVERNEAVVVVEHRVFDPLGHGGSGQLLQSRDKLLLEVACHPQCDQVAQKFEQRGLDVGPLPNGVSGRDVDISTVALRQPVRVGLDVGAIHRKPCDEFTQRVCKLMARVITMTPMALADLKQQIGEAIDVACVSATVPSGIPWRFTQIR